MTLASCKCGRRWSGTTSAHCSLCHEHFSTVANFDKHKPSLRGCGDPRTMTRTKGDGTVVPVFKKSLRQAGGVIWIGWAEDPRFADTAEDAA